MSRWIFEDVIKKEGESLRELFQFSVKCNTSQKLRFLFQKLFLFKKTVLLTDFGVVSKGNYFSLLD